MLTCSNSGREDCSQGYVLDGTHQLLVVDNICFASFMKHELCWNPAERAGGSRM